MATSRDPKELARRLGGLAPDCAAHAQGFCALRRALQSGARELGFKDTGALWRSKYDMPPDDFARELDRLWEQVRPLYVQLHAYVRWKLREKYGDQVVPASGPIPADLLGNMWAQNWDNVYPLVAPPNADPGYDLTQISEEPQHRRARHGPLRRALLHLAGICSPAADVLGTVDVRQAARPRRGVPRQRLGRGLRSGPAREDVHRHHRRVFLHDSSRTGAQLLPARIPAQPYLFRDSANDGFHEAIGDTIALSITPPYLVKLGLIDQAPDPSKDLGLLMQKALEKIAFLPFGLLIDQWRWKVFSGEITPEQYNQAWWALRLKYQGVAPPVPRSEEDFDPGAKYHVAGQRSLHALFPGGHPAIPVSSRSGENGGLHRAAQPLLDLR